MKTSNLIKLAGALTLLASSSLAGIASADSGYLSIHFGERDAHRMHHAIPGSFGYHAHWQDAKPSGHDIDRIQANQSQRILAGMQNGALTPLEAARLRSEQARIELMQQRFRADGWLDARERNHLMAELGEANRNIWHEKHDGQGQFVYWPQPHYYGR